MIRARAAPDAPAAIRTRSRAARGPGVTPRALLERVDEPEVGVDRGVDFVGARSARRRRLATRAPPRWRTAQVRLARSSVARPQLALALELATPLRRLLADGRGRGRADPGRLSPSATSSRRDHELVVLALLEARVVPERMAFEDLALDENGRVEERRAEERGPAARRSRRPASRAASRRDRRRAPRTADPTTAGRRCRRMRASWRSSRRGMATSSASRRATYVPRASSGRGSASRRDRAARRCAARVGACRRRSRGSRRRVGGRVVDDHDLEIRDGLTEDARERSPDVFLAVVDGDERGDRAGAAATTSLAYGPCRGSFRRSTSSSRRCGRTGRARPAPRLDSRRRHIEPLRVIVVDQNEDERVAEIAHGRRHRARARRAERGLSRARNAGSARVEADLVAFPDDDCVYPPGSSSASRTSSRTRGWTVSPGVRWTRQGARRARGDRPCDAHGRQPLEPRRSRSRSSSGATSCSASARSTSAWASAPGPWSSGEEIDYLDPRGAVGARIEYDPSLVVRHPVRQDDRASARATVRASATCCASTAIRTGRRADARAPARRHCSRRSFASTALGPGTSSRRSAAAFAATAARSARTARRDGRARARARTVRLHARGGRGVRGQIGEHRVSASASSSPLGGSSRSKPSGCGHADAGVVADELRHAAARAGRRPAGRHAIASITRLGHGSLTFVWRRTCARRKIAGASSCE